MQVNTFENLEIIKEDKYITINGIKLRSNIYTMGWLINVLAVYGNFRKGYMDSCFFDRTTNDQYDLLNILGLSEHFGCIMTKETVEYVNSWNVTRESNNEEFNLKLGELFGYFIPNKASPKINQERIDISINLGDYSEVYVNNQINQSNIVEFYNHINKVVDMYQKIVNIIGLKYMIKVNVTLSIQTQKSKIAYKMTLDEFYNYKIHQDKHKVEYIFN
jgi:hypothetical protein